MRHRWASPDRYELLKTKAKEMRENMTSAENFLWIHLKGKALGVKFLRQYIIGDYIADFACIEKRLVVEVDGDAHSQTDAIEHDAQRTASLNRMGWNVLRFRNECILLDIHSTLNIIKDIITTQ